MYMVFICVVFATEAAGAKLTGHLKLPGDLTPFLWLLSLHDLLVCKAQME